VQMQDAGLRQRPGMTPDGGRVTAVLVPLYFFLREPKYAPMAAGTRPKMKSVAQTMKMPPPMLSRTKRKTVVATIKMKTNAPNFERSPATTNIHHTSRAVGLSGAVTAEAYELERNANRDSRLGQRSRMALERLRPSIHTSRMPSEDELQAWASAAERRAEGDANLLRGWPGFWLRLDDAGFTMKSVLGRSRFAWVDVDGPFRAHRGYVIFNLTPNARSASRFRASWTCVQRSVLGYDASIQPWTVGTNVEELAALLNAARFGRLPQR
jgi:hypothetical protein